MANHVVKILYNDDGDKEENPKWHYVFSGYSDAERTLCRGEVFGFGEGRAVFKEKLVDKGGITCPTCLEIIKMFKNVKL